MAVKIRLLRLGRKKKPFYRIVVMDSKTRRDGRYLEKLGYYDPLTNPATVKLDKEKVLAWLEKGAIPTETVFNLLQKEGVALEWHLVKNKVNPQAANIELQKWAMLKKTPVTKIESQTAEPEVSETPEPENNENPELAADKAGEGEKHPEPAATAEAGEASETKTE